MRPHWKRINAVVRQRIKNKKGSELKIYSELKTFFPSSNLLFFFILQEQVSHCACVKLGGEDTHLSSDSSAIPFCVLATTPRLER